jgi:hypothetical protein|tara:strand:+ start:1965 stop:2138 length:174 start_codon:yes stop_codon:yes gene_type:complete
MTKKERKNLQAIGDFLQVMYSEGVPFKWCVHLEKSLEAYSALGGPKPRISVHKGINQ